MLQPEPSGFGAADVRCSALSPCTEIVNSMPSFVELIPGNASSPMPSYAKVVMSNSHVMTFDDIPALCAFALIQDGMPATFGPFITPPIQPCAYGNQAVAKFALHSGLLLPS